MKLFCKFIVDLLDCIENDKKQFEFLFVQHSTKVSLCKKSDRSLKGKVKSIYYFV